MIDATPTLTRFDSERLEVPTLTLTVWIPDLYPDPLFPILIEEIVPSPETTAVPPAETKGW